MAQSSIEDEIKRKAALNIPLTNPTAASTKLYKAAQSNVKSPVTPGVYGSNVANFDPSNQQHIALADAGQEWWKAKQSGDTTALAAAAKKGSDIRSQIAGSAFNPTKGVTSITGEFPVTLNGASNGIFTPGSYGGYDPAAQEKAYLDMQLASLRGQDESSKLSTQYGIDQNKSYLEEQLSSLGEEQALARDALQQHQNRFGGLYSGGYSYQGGMQDRAFGAQEGGLRRDIAARNQQLLDQYGNQAHTIAQQIQSLQFNQPDIIRQRIQEWLNNERQYGLDYAKMFGNLNGQSTLAQRQANLGAALDVSNLTGQVVTPQNDWTGLYRQSSTGNNPTAAQKNWQTQFGADEAYRNSNLDLQRAQENRLSSGSSSGGSSSGGISSGGGEKVTTNSFNDMFNTLQRRYGVVNYSYDADGNVKTDSAGNPIIKYTNSKNEDQLAKIVLEVVNLGLNDDQSVKMLNKFGITLDQAKKLVGIGG